MLMTHGRVAFALVFFATSSLLRADSNWNQWRGPNGDGHSIEKNVPVKWDAKSVAWKTTLPGRGQSSPMIWGKRIFLTTALENGKQRVVLCVDRTNGKILWQKTAWTGEPEKTHKMNGWATASCTTDGELLFAFFGKGGLHCYTVDGKHVWSRDLGQFPGSWGTGASPILVGDLLVQNCDAAGESFIVAVEKKTGKDVWKTPRGNLPRGGWSTPIVIDADGRKEIVLNGETGVSAYDPKTGKFLWFAKSKRGRGEPTVTPGNGHVYVLNGQPGDVYAVRPGGKGDVSESQVKWRALRKSGRDQPSPILVGKYLIVVSMSGITSCYDSESGKELWKERLNGRFVSTPIAAGKVCYFVSESGETVVIEPGPAPKIAARNSVNPGDSEIFRASLTPSAGQVFARSDKVLYCIDVR